MGRSKFLIIPILIAVAIFYTGANMYSKSSKELPEFKDVRRETLQFMTYYERLRLLPSEKALLKRALSKLKAPCCAESSALTC